LITWDLRGRVQVVVLWERIPFRMIPFCLPTGRGGRRREWESGWGINLHQKGRKILESDVEGGEREEELPFSPKGNLEITGPSELGGCFETALFSNTRGRWGGLEVVKSFMGASGGKQGVSTQNELEEPTGERG